MQFQLISVPARGQLVTGFTHCLYVWRVRTCRAPVHRPVLAHTLPRPTLPPPSPLTIHQHLATHGAYPLGIGTRLAVETILVQVLRIASQVRVQQHGVRVAREYEGGSSETVDNPTQAVARMGSRARSPRRYIAATHDRQNGAPRTCLQVLHFFCPYGWYLYGTDARKRLVRLQECETGFSADPAHGHRLMLHAWRTGTAGLLHQELPTCSFQSVTCFH